ncbi:transcriptional regulator LldR [Alcaligenes sp. SDU_A2]|uniref:transcriptional regulator LldR n=1 Tax=Alcaligenes sp. SDU_A2 TaxID=3136634 RepID=UPI002C9167BC|nr:transcriptional regulator LldR [Alcaligenes sp.]HRL27799.1 transcriptional regulator LldR [Alcaligenes sp.]
MTTLSSARLSDQVAEKIRQLIHDQQLQPGDRIPSERHLAELLAVSRVPIREALRSLNSQGLLVTRRGGGTYVQESELMNWPAQSIAPLGELISQDPLYRYDVLEARHALEACTVWHAAQRATETDKNHIRRCFDIMVRHQQNQDAELSARADAQFHLAIAQASHNVVLLQIMNGLFQLVFSTVKENRRAMFEFDNAREVELLTRQHESLMDAILNGEADQARDQIALHLDHVQTKLRLSEENNAREQRLSRFNSHLSQS